jgi:hypothetical protein
LLNTANTLYCSVQVKGSKQVWKEEHKNLKKSLFYLRFWLFVMYFTAFWLLYGCFAFIKKLVIENNFDIQPLYLILGMLILFFQSKNEHSKAKS